MMPQDPNMMSILDRARAYLAKCPPAISGQGGHNLTFSVATALVHGFALDFEEASRLLAEYNSHCQPPWSESELQHKVQSAASTPHSKPRGFLLGDTPIPAIRPGPLPYKPAPTPAPASTGKHKPIPTDKHIPEEIPDGARLLLKTCFREGEGVRIVGARLNDDGKEIPDGDGPTLSREEWLRKLDARAGDPNRIWGGSDGAGTYIAINPLKVGCNRDADVTNYRHALVEFDKSLSIEEQWNLYLQTNLPCAAVIFSGRQSLHAWVKIDAADRKEFDERITVLYAQFLPYDIDPKNINPSRLSRLPNCKRFDRRQELLALNIGAPSWIDWMADKDAGGLGQEITLGDMLAFDPALDPNCILGRRWLSRGSSCMWIGQSGIGKSALAIQGAVSWALARSFFGIAAHKVLKSLLIQHENDLGDCSEMLKGVLMGLAPEPIAAARTLKENLVIIRERTHTGTAFLRVLQRLIERHHPDLVWLDPLYTFLGDDINSQKACADFLCGGLGPITEASGVCWMFMHHTGKPSTDPKSRKGWTQTDYSYAGLGSSIITNWVRATCTMLKRGENIYELQLGKRGRRAGAIDTHGQRTTSLFLQHSPDSIFWQQIAEPEIATAGAGGEGPGRPSAGLAADVFHDAIRGQFLSYTQSLARIQTLADCGVRKAKMLFAGFKPDLLYDPNFKTYTAP